ncbi:MAG: peptidylprolyl isomerase [Clostridiaceae bacterium]
MKNIKQIVSAVLLAGVLAGCSPTTATTTTAGATSPGTTTAGTTTAGTSATTTAAATTPIETMAIDRTIILAELSGMTITSGQVEAEFERMLDAFRSQYGADLVNSSLATLQEQKSSILDQLIRNELFNKKADELNILKESPEALAEYDKIVATNITQYGGQAQFDAAIIAAGYTNETYKAEILKAYRYKALGEELTKDITVSDAEIQAKYEELKTTQFTQAPGATISHIFFGEPTDTAAEAKANEAKKKLDEGAKFEDIALEYGKDASSAQGGLLGSYPYDTTELGPDFMAEVIKLKKEGEISVPVKTSFGWHIIKVTNVVSEPKLYGLTDKVPGENNTEVLVSSLVSDGIKVEKQNAKITELIATWEKEYNVKKYPEKIPMNVKVEPTEGSTTTPSATTPSTTTPSTTTPSTTGAATKP